MVRSNFDYTNRTSSGERLGISIASDFSKKAAQTTKPSRSLKTPSKSSKAAAIAQDSTSCPDPPKQTRLDIRIPNKVLTDAGFHHIALSLVELLKTRADVCLSDLDLSGNCLTSSSVCDLANIVQHAPDLRTLDISHNDISITNTVSATSWERFMNACCSTPLSIVIDISSNKNLGNLASEIMARVVSGSQGIRQSRRDSHQGSGARSDMDKLVIQSSAGAVTTHDMNQDTAPDAEIDVESSGESGPVSSTPLGDRVVILLLGDVGLSEHAAMFINSVRSRRSPALKVSMPDPLLNHSIETLGKDGLHLLSLGTKSSETTINDTCQASDELDDSVLLDIERTTKKIQRNVISHQGYTSVQLWSAAMKVLTVSRKVYMLRSPHLESLQNKHTEEDNESSKQDIDDALAQLDLNAEQGCDVNIGTGEQQSHPAPIIPYIKSYAATIAGTLVESPNNLPRSPHGGLAMALSEFAHGKENNRIRKKRRGRPGTETTRSAPPHDDAGPTTTPGSEPSLHEKYVEWQQNHLRVLQSHHEGASNGYRDTSLRCQLPLPVCLLILHFSLDHSDLRILSHRQQTKAFEWGQLHDSLRTEHDWRNKDKASQIWMLLEALECLEYD